MNDRADADVFPTYVFDIVALAKTPVEVNDAINIKINNFGIFLDSFEFILIQMSYG